MLPSDFFHRNVVLSFQEDAIGIPKIALWLTRGGQCGTCKCRVNSVSGFAMAASLLSRAARCTELHRSRGTEGPNPLGTCS